MLSLDRWSAVDNAPNSACRLKATSPAQGGFWSLKSGTGRSALGKQYLAAERQEWVVFGIDRWVIAAISSSIGMAIAEHFLGIEQFRPS